MDENNVKYVIKDNKISKIEVILYFTYKENDYIIYTFNQLEGEDLIVLHASKVNYNEENQMILVDIENKEDWTKIKEIMKGIVEY